MISTTSICDTKVNIINFDLLPFSHSKLIRDTCIECFEKYGIQDGLKNGDFLFNKIEISKRLKSTAGQCEFSTKAIEPGKSIHCFNIKLAYNNYLEFGIDSVIKTLRHEMAHMIEVIKHGSTGHGERFKEICFTLGGHMNKEMAGIKYKSCATDDFCGKEKKYTYQCPCGVKVNRQRKITSPKILRGTCKKCGTLVMDMKIKINH